MLRLDIQRYHGENKGILVFVFPPHFLDIFRFYSIWVFEFQGMSVPLNIKSSMGGALRPGSIIQSPPIVDFLAYLQQSL